MCLLLFPEAGVNFEFSNNFGHESGRPHFENCGTLVLAVCAVKTEDKVNTQQLMLLAKATVTSFMYLHHITTLCLVLELFHEALECDLN